MQSDPEQSSELSKLPQPKELGNCLILGTQHPWEQSASNDW